MSAAYTTIDGWLSEAEAETLASLAAGLRVLEIGTWHGRSTVAMAVRAELVVTVDHYQGDSGTGKPPKIAKTLVNLDPWLDRVIPIVGSWQDVLPLLDLRRFDLAFADADHSYEQTHDLLSVLKGIPLIAVHDYAWDYPDVVRACTETIGQPSRVVDTLAIFGERT